MKNETLLKIRSQIHSSRHFPHKDFQADELEIQCEHINSELLICQVMILSVGKSTYFFPFDKNDSNPQINWTNPQWLSMLGIHPVGWHYLDDASHPIIHNSQQLIKFFPNSEESSLEREIQIAQFLSNYPYALLPNRSILYKNRIVALSYPFKPGVNLWEFLTQQDRNYIKNILHQATLILKEIHLQLPKYQLHHFSPSPLFHQLLHKFDLNTDNIHYVQQLSHDDLHLGQFIYHDDQIYCVDFGGCPLEDKWWGENPSCAEKDYASLLRSLDYRLQFNADEPLSALEILRYCLEWQLNPQLFSLCYLARLQYEIAYESKYRPNFQEIPRNGLNAWIEFAKLI